MIDKWHFYAYVSQQIKDFGYETLYKQNGQALLDRLANRCEENFEIVRWPEDEEILEVIKEFKKENNYV